MNIDNLSDDVFRVIFPLINEIESEKLELNFEEFCEGMQTFMQKLSPYDKEILTKNSKSSN